MSTPNDSIDLRDYFAAAALSGIVVKRINIEAANAALDLPDSTPQQKSTRNAALAALKTQYKKDVELAYIYAQAAIDHRDEVTSAEAMAVAA